MQNGSSHRGNTAIVSLVVVCILLVGALIFSYRKMAGTQERSNLTPQGAVENATTEKFSGDATRNTGDAGTNDVKTITLTGKSFQFSTNEIRVKKGEKVRIVFSSTEGFHDWSLEGYDVATKSVRPGEETSVEFLADKAGSFEYFCSVGSHRAMGMKGALIVE